MADSHRTVPALNNAPINHHFSSSAAFAALCYPPPDEILSTVNLMNNVIKKISAVEADKRLFYRIFPPHSLPCTLPS